MDCQLFLCRQTESWLFTKEILMSEENPVFQDPFYIKKFMEIQQQNIVLYKTLLKIKENPNAYQVVVQELGNDVFSILEKCPA
jgi:hypothetical protein